MNIKVHSNYDEMSRAAADFVAEQIRKNPAALLCFPSGDTPTAMLKFLVEDVGKGELDFKDCSFVGLDEWVGLDGSDEGSCRHYMDQHLFIPLHTHPGKIHFFNGTAYDLDKECSRINKFIRESGPIDLMIVGLGLNGHVGLNEPGVDFGLYSHISVLAEETKHSAQKYFKKEVVLTQGITLGPRHILESRVAVIIASGSKKSDVVAKALEQEISNNIPASIIQNHTDAYAFIDCDAAGLLSNNNVK